MGIYGYDELVRLDKLYGEVLKECNFVGEVVLEEKELDKICRSLIGYVMDYWEDRFNNVLVVTCVNLAYYYYDEKGYWTHFEEKAGVALDSYLKGVIGNKIETVLELKGFIKFKRKGPFRYVGAILEQTGVTHNNIPGYANIVKSMIDSYGIKGVINLSIDKYERFINDFPITKRIKEHLLDRAGWEFNTYVVKIIYYIQEGLLNVENIDSFKGIHPKFWGEFLKYFSVNDSGWKKDILRRFNPVLMLNIKKRVMYLKFPQSTFDIEINEKMVHYNNTSEFTIDKVSNIQSSYSGKILTKTYGEYMWRTNGWNYLQEKHIYFNENGAAIRNIEHINKGTYFIVCREKQDIPKGNVIEIVGEMYISNLIGYKLFKIDVKGNEHRELAYTLLEWESSKRKLNINSYFDIFQNKLPKIKINSLGSNLDKDSAIFYDIGTGVKRVNDIKGLTDFYTDVNNHIPCVGEIWTESLNRNRTIGRQSELRFCLIPKCELDISEGLYNEDETVKIVSNSPLIKFKGCKINDNEIVTINKHTLIEGYININNQAVDFNLLISRTKLMLEDDEEKMYFTMDEDCAFRCSLHARPYDTGVFLIKSDKDKIELKRDIKFDNKGKCTLSIKDIVESLSQRQFSLCTMNLIISNKNYLANRYIINVEYLIKNLNDTIKNHEVMKIINCIDINMFKKLIQLQTLLLGTNDYIEYTEEAKYSNILNEFYNRIVICSQVFNDVNITKNNELIRLDYEIIKSTKVKTALRWYERATKVTTEDNDLEIELLCKEYNMIKCPELMRWQSQIDLIYSKLINLRDKDTQLLQWKEEVIKQNKRKLNSDISKKVGGKEITIAWIEYYKGNYEKCIRLLNLIEHRDDIVEDLICLLKIIIYLKLARLTAVYKEFSRTIKDKNIKRVVNTYKGIYMAIYNDIYSLSEDIINVNMIPLRYEEISLIHLSSLLMSCKCGSDIEKLKEFTEGIKDNWILGVLLVKCLNSTMYGQNANLLSKLKFDFNTIPNSPEKNKIIEIINK